MISIELSLPQNYTDNDIKKAIGDFLSFEYKKIFTLLRREIVLTGDLPYYKARVGIEVEERIAARLCKKGLARPCPSLNLKFKATAFKKRPIVVGSGPCGLFAALALAEAGACPIIIERGEDIDSRKKKVACFFGGGELDEESNIQFGEGGAGSFSDGKLKHGALDRYIHKVLSEFVLCGAPERILYDSAPHVGTDLLYGIIKNIRKKIISLGGEFKFKTKLSQIITKEKKLCAIQCQTKNGIEELITDHLILATGHSARDTFAMLNGIGIAMEARGFGIGVRIEHRREHIDKMIYGKHFGHIEDAASYHFVTHLNNGRSVYSFCMCPGGSVVAAASQRFGIVTNGMSQSARNGENSNAAFLVSLTPSDFGNDPMAGLLLQTKLEKRAFDISCSYKAPAVRMEDFVKGQASSSIGDVRSTYPFGVVLAKPNEFLPDFVQSSLCQAISDFQDYREGFYCPDALLTGIETRTTSPIRLLRDSRHMSVSLEGLYPCGEGAGYSGGIVSSATDGIKTAEFILSAPPQM